MPKGAKYGGRQKGTPNKTTRELRDMVQIIVESSLPEAIIRLASIEDDAKYIDALTKLLKFVLPSNIDVTSGGKKIDLKPIDFVSRQDKDK